MNTIQLLLIGVLLLLVVAGLFSSYLIANPEWARAWVVCLATITAILSACLWAALF